MTTYEWLGGLTEKSYRRCSLKKVYLKIWQNSQENTCARVSFLIKLQEPAILLKKDSGTPLDTGRKLNVHKMSWTSSERLMYVQFTPCVLGDKCFPVSFAKFLRTPILKNIYEDC